MNIFFWATVPLCWWKSNFTSSAVYTEPTIMQIVWYTTVHSIPLNHLKFLVVNWELPPERKWCLFQSSAYASASDLCLPRQSLMPARYAHPLHSFAWNQEMRGISSCLFYPSPLTLLHPPLHLPVGVQMCWVLWGPICCAAVALAQPVPDWGPDD